MKVEGLIRKKRGEFRSCYPLMIMALPAKDLANSAYKMKYYII